MVPLPRIGFLAPVLAAALLVSCATAPFHRVDGVLEQGRYEESAAALEKNRSSLYRAGDTILYYLDKGMLTHYAGLYPDSSRLLEAGERAIEAAYTRSILQEAGAYLINDLTRDYAGEDYEDIYTNSFNALNYYHRGDLDEALVEIRRMNNKIRNLADKYGAAVSSLQRKALEESLPIPANPQAPSSFNDSALARYLGMLFYRARGRDDDARIDGDYLRLAFANSPALYPHPLPASLDGELEIPQGMARLNILAFAGLSPVKKEQNLRLPIGNRYIKIALPELVYRPSAVSRVELVFDDGRRFDLELLENIEAVAAETFKARKNIIYLRSVIRASLKGVSSAALDSMAGESEGEASLVFGLLSLGAQIFAEASEQADLRISRYFPARAYVGGLTLSPGRYSFDLIYYNRQGGTLASFRCQDVPVLENTLNLTEVICLK
ncbi:MAG: hypothetical protein LBQ46_06100 [Treponema sp.]|jgi:hypothetical protein|nr:hypothetical protein [Treponema sp.]